MSKGNDVKLTRHGRGASRAVASSMLNKDLTIGSDIAGAYLWIADLGQCRNIIDFRYDRTIVKAAYECGTL